MRPTTPRHARHLSVVRTPSDADLPHVYHVEVDGTFLPVCVFCEQLVLPFEDDEPFPHQYCCPLHGVDTGE